MEFILILSYLAVGTQSLVFEWLDHDVSENDSKDPVNNPLPRAGAATWTHLNQLWLFGGRTSYLESDEQAAIVQSDLWFYVRDHGRWQKIQHTGTWPSGRHLSAACTFNSYLILFGGEQKILSDALGDTWIFDTQQLSWEEIHEVGPSPRKDMIVACFPDRMTIMGGLGQMNFLQSDVWSFHFENRQWSKEELNHEATLTPLPRSGSASWTDGVQYIYLFGGNAVNFTQTNHFFGAGYMSDLWQFDVLEGNWQKLAGPSQPGFPADLNKQPHPGSRRGTAAFYSNEELWLYAGEGASDAHLNVFESTQCLDDVWKFNLHKNRWSYVGGTKLSMQTGHMSEKPRSNKNLPSCRRDTQYWLSDKGLYFFGGEGMPINVISDAEMLSDMWLLDFLPSKDSVRVNRAIVLGLTFGFGVVLILVLIFLLRKYCRNQHKVLSFSSVRYHKVASD